MRKKDLKLMSFLIMQEMQVEIIFMPGTLAFENSIIYPN
jgi:hypothetical protein